MFYTQLYQNIWSAVNNFSTTWKSGIVPTMYIKGYYNIEKYLTLTHSRVWSLVILWTTTYIKNIRFVTHRNWNTLLRHGNGTLGQKNFTGTSRWVNKYVVHKLWLFLFFLKSLFSSINKSMIHIYTLSLQ